jgi:GTPase SAR1 family protein
VKSILLIFGPSGVGKSHVSKQLQKNGFLYVHFDTDRPTRSFAANGFPREWDDDFRNVNIAHLVAVLRARLDNEHAGTVVSFPTVDVFTPEMLGQASELGATPIVLWGTKEHCMMAAEQRIRRKGMPFNRSRYEWLNEPTFLACGGREYGAFRIEAFREDGSRCPDDQLVANVMGRGAA